jgi:PAS domain S-box-containing protein
MSQMTISNDMFFQAMFNTSVPRIIVKTDGPDRIIVSTNAAYKTFLSTQSEYFEQAILKSVFDNGDAQPAELEIIPIGGIDGYPEYVMISILRNSISSIINFIPSGMAILRGKNMVLEVVNQSMLDLWNRDESIKGKALLEFLPELEDQEFPSLLQQVYTTGTPYKTVDAPVQIQTADGLHVKYMDFSYTALRNGAGETESILVLAEDVTERTIGRMREQQLAEELTVMNEELAASNEELAAMNEEISATNEELMESREEQYQLHEDLLNSEARFRNLVQRAPVPICILTGPEHTFESVNDRMLSLVGKTERIIGQPLKTAIPELERQDLIALMDQVYSSGKLMSVEESKVMFDHGGQQVEGYYTYICQPIKDSAGLTTGLMIVAMEMTSQVLARKKLEASENRFRFLLNAIPQQVWTATPAGRVDYVNQVMSDDLGKGTAGLIMNGWQEFLHPDDFSRCMEKYTDALKTGVTYVDEFRLLFADGKYHWHLGRLVPFIENDEIQLWIGTNTNIDLQKANELKKDEFLSVASHELKTPLTSIKAFNQLLQYTKEEEKRRMFTSKSQDNIIRLERLINDLLDVTKINAGKMVYNMKPFNFRQMLQESIDNVQHTSPAHEIVLEGTVDFEYTGDRFRLEQVMQNILTNAVKYSPEAAKVIVNSKAELGNIVVSVQDFGIGIAEKDLHRLFERYYRADNTSMRFEGLGLGLFISSEIIKRHQGSFWIESELGKGSTFFFRLPLKRSGNTDHIHITYVEAGAYLYVDWIGFQNIETVKKGCMEIYKALQEYKVTKVVNDNTNVLGSWSDAAEWVGEVWFPAAEEAGLKHFAWIYAPAAFSKLSANKSVEKSKSGVVIRLFTDLALGVQWIKEVE